MNENNNHGEASNPEAQNAGATPSSPESPRASAPDAGAQTPGNQGAPTWQPPHGAPAQQGGAPGYVAPPQAGQPVQPPHPAQSGASPQPTHPGYSQWAAQGSPTQQYGSAPQPPSGQPTHAASGHPAQGTAFGQAAYATQPTSPLDPSLLTPTQTHASETQKKSGAPVKIAGLILAAALVGGVAGFGGSAIGSAVFNPPTSQSASGPEAVTVNNPGSVNETTAIAADVLPSVVTIEVAGSKESGSGSGVVLHKDGYVLTNTHVVTLGGAVADPTIRVTTSDGRIYTGTVVGTDPIYDLAVIKLKGAKDLKPIEFADSGNLNVGDTAVAVGAPLGLANSVTTGIVSALNRSIQVASSALPEQGTEDQQPDQQGDGGEGSQGGPFQFDIPGMGSQQAKQSISIAVIQTDAAINPGNSGGALVNSEGHLIGINVAIATAGGSSSSSESGSIGLGFSIPSNIAKRVADEIISDGSATHGLLGATVRDASSMQDATVAGAVIVDPTPGGAAAKEGLKKGDVVTEFNGVPITNASDLTAQVRAAAAGSKATVTYVRSGKSYTADVTLGELKL